MDGQDLLAQWDQAFCRRRSFVEGDPYATAFREGQRDLVEQILDALALAEAADGDRGTGTGDGVMDVPLLLRTHEHEEPQSDKEPADAPAASRLENY